MKKQFIISLFVFCFWLSLNTYALDIPLTIQNRETSAKIAEPITSGIPFAEGILLDTSRVCILQGTTQIPAQFRITAKWPDGSIRWLLADFQIDLPASGSSSVTLKTETTPISFTGITIDNQSSQIIIHTGTSDWILTKDQFTVGNNYFQITSSGTTYTAIPQTETWEIEESGAMKSVIKVEGHFYNGSELFKNNLVGFKARLFFYRNKSNIRAQLTFKNNNSFGWNYQTPGPIATLSGVQFGTPLLPSGGSYIFGQGVEKTWDIEITSTGGTTVRESRFNEDGSLRVGYYYPRPIALASPFYYASTNAWGKIIPPITSAGNMQGDFDLFEKIQRAKVIQQDVQDPPGKTGISIWGHLYQDITKWNDYGDLKWGGGYGPLSGNHYDWPYSMMLHYLRTGRSKFLDAAHVFARHEIDFDLYHTNENGTAYNYQKQWESRPSHDSSGNDFGPGRPSHSWCQGYTLYWLITGDSRGYDAFTEMMEGIRQYVYDSFNINGYIDTNEIRISGWLIDNLVVMWRIGPDHVFTTANNGNKSIRQTMKDIMKNVFDLEAAAGKNGYVYAENPPDPTLRQPLMNCYFVEPAIKAYSEVFKNRDNAYATELLGLIKRMTSWLISITYGGTFNGQGYYLPRQIPYMVDTDLTQQTDGQIPYILMALNAAGFCYSETGQQSYFDYMRSAFKDYVRYFGVQGGDQYVEDPSTRTPTAYNSSVYPDTESKVHGWSGRYGQYYLAAEAAILNAPIRVTSPNGGEIVIANATYKITWTTNSTANTHVQILYSTDNGLHYNHTVSNSTPNTGSYNWTIPNTPSTQCRIKIIGVNDPSIYDSSDSVFTINPPVSSIMKINRSGLNFGGVYGSTSNITAPQNILLTISGNTGLSWTAASDSSWISISPGSGTGGSSIQIGVNLSGLNIGTYTGTVVFTVSGADNSPQTLQVELKILEQSGFPSGSFDTPEDNSTVTGSIGVTGWVLDDIGVTGVQIWREGVMGEGNHLVYIGDAVFVDDARPDVELAFPDSPFNYRGGWGYMMLTYGLPNNGMNDTFVIHAIATDMEGNTTDLGTKTIHCNNGAAVTPFGAIDTPEQGGTATGKSYINFGWALTPPPSVIPLDGSSVIVFIDGEPKGHIGYNQYRPELKNLFPTYLNSDGAGGYFYMDTTSYDNGLHTIAWSATDDNGHTGGIGSRFFTVFNSETSTISTTSNADLKSLSFNGNKFESTSRTGVMALNPNSIEVRKGFNLLAPMEAVFPDSNGVYSISVSSGSSIEIHLSGEMNGVFNGYLMIKNEYRRLPVGSVLKGNNFYWQVYPVFRGKFLLLFITSQESKSIEITIR